MLHHQLNMLPLSSHITPLPMGEGLGVGLLFLSSPPATSPPFPTHLSVIKHIDNQWIKTVKRAKWHIGTKKQKTKNDMIDTIKLIVHT